MTSGSLPGPAGRTCKFAELVPSECDRPPLPAPAHGGRPPEYCDRPDHNPGAFKRRQARTEREAHGQVALPAEGPAAGGAPVSAAAATLAAQVETFGRHAAVLDRLAPQIFQALRTLGDPAALEAQLAAVAAAADQRVSAAEARAAELAQQRLAAERAHQAADAACDQARAEAAAAGEERDAAQAARQAADQRAGEAAARCDQAEQQARDAETARDQALAEAREAAADRQRVQDRLDRADAALAETRRLLDAERAAAATAAAAAAAELATARAELGGLRETVDRERADRERERQQLTDRIEETRRLYEDRLAETRRQHADSLAAHHAAQQAAQQAADDARDQLQQRLTHAEADLARLRHSRADAQPATVDGHPA